VFDLSITKLLALAVIALIIFGPNELPRIARQAGRALRDLRQIAEGAKADLREGLGPEFQDFDFQDLNPKRFVAKHLLEESATETASEAPVDTMTAVQDHPLADTATATPNGKAVIGKDAIGNAETGLSDMVPEEIDDRPPFDLEAT
jgi:sec-independent protein translocase protein TatB